MLPSSSSSRAGITSTPRPFPPSSDSDVITGINETTTSSSSMRPRNRRLISTEHELVSTSATSTPSGSRAVSPIPRKHPSRSTAGLVGKGNGRPVGGLLAPEGGGKSQPLGSASTPVGFGGIWEGGWISSWSALQGLASSVLGVDTEGESSVGPLGGSLGRKAQGRQGPGRQLSAAWGPEGLPKNKDPGIGMGSTAERDSVLRTRKMAGVLEGREVDNRTLDTNGVYKKRSSLEESRQDTQHGDEGDALVYVHHVQPQDTLAGVVLRYNCQPAVFRKANRFWPNDSIQIRKVVVLPVDACAIKGRPCEPPSPDSQGVDLLAPTPGVEDPPPFPNGGTWPRASSSRNETSAERPEIEEEHPWTHVRWILVDSSPYSNPVEIARMPQNTLGYFPPRRRKSQTTISTVSTPRGSFDFPPVSQSLSESSHDPSGSPASTPSRRTSNLGPRPSKPLSGGYFPPQSSSTRPRRESVGQAAERLGWMRGPGGVGTLGKNVRKPGPSNDGLNSWANKHIPGLAIDSLPSTSILGGESAHFGFGDELASIAESPVNGLRSNRLRNGTSTPSGSGQGLGIENAAAAIEGWVRRLAIKPGTPNLGGRSHIENADLIELLDGPGSDDGRGFELNPGSLKSATPGVGGSGREDLDGLIRGRAAAGAKGGKTD